MYLNNIIQLKKHPLNFSSKIEVPQLGLAQLGTFTARARSSRKIPARNSSLLRAYCPNLYPGAVNPSRHASIYVVLAAFGEFLVGNIHFGTSMMMDQYSLQL